MKAGVLHGERDIRVDEVDEPGEPGPGEAVLRIVRSSVCGSDLWSYRGISSITPGAHTGHELTGVVEAVGEGVTDVAEGDLVVSAFAWSCGTCRWCAAGLQTSCVTGQFASGGQAQRVTVPMVEGSVWTAPSDTPEERWDQLHLLSDVLLTGYHAAKLAGVGAPGLDGAPVDVAVVIGDGAVGLSGVVSAKLLGATTIVAVGRHEERLDAARGLGATHVVEARGDGYRKQVRGLVDGGAAAVLECVGTTGSLVDAAAVVAPGGSVGSVGVPHGVDGAPWLAPLFGKNASLRPGVAPVRAYMDEVGPLVASGELDVSAIASHRFALEDLPAAYEAMDRRECVKAIVLPEEA